MGPLSIRPDRSTRHRAHPKRNALGARILEGKFWLHMAGGSLPVHSPIRFLFAFSSEPWENHRPLPLSLTPTLTLHSWISLHMISSGVHWACVTHCTTGTICAILTIDDLEGREACRSCSWLLTGARQRLAVDIFRPGIPGCSRLCPWQNGRNACVKHCFAVNLRSLSTHSSMCVYFAGAFLHSG